MQPVLNDSTGALAELVYMSRLYPVPEYANYTCAPVRVRGAESFIVCDVTTRIVVVLKPGATFVKGEHFPTCLQIRQTKDILILETLPGVILNLIAMHHNDPDKTRIWTDSIYSCAKHVCMAGYFMGSEERCWLAKNPDITHLAMLHNESQYPQIPLQQLGSEHVYPCRVLFPKEYAFEWSIDDRFNRVNTDLPVSPRMLFPDGMTIKRPVWCPQRITLRSSKTLLELAYDKVCIDLIPSQVKDTIVYKLANQRKESIEIIIPPGPRISYVYYPWPLS